MSLELWTERTAERTEEGKRETAMIGGQPGFRHSAAHFHSDMSFQLDLFSHIFPNLTVTLVFTGSDFHSDLSFQLDLFSHIFPNLTVTLVFTGSDFYLDLSFQLDLFSHIFPNLTVTLFSLGPIFTRICTFTFDQAPFSLVFL